MKQLGLAIALWAAMGSTPALAELWAPVQAESSIRFRAVQEGADFEGLFNRYNTSIELSMADPTRAHIEATIDMDSVDTLYDERDQYLRGEDWFHVQRWPYAHFVTDRIVKSATGYMADGLLTLRDQTKPVALAFTITELPDGRLLFVGKTRIQRLDFGVGQGQWTNTDWVGNEVDVEVKMTLQSALP